MAVHHRGIANRLQWVLDSGRVESASSWALAAGLSRTYVTAFIDRARKGVVNDIGVNTLAALAEIASLNPAWLAYGVGSADPAPPNLRAVVEARPKSYSEQLVQQASMLREIIGEPDVPEEQWRTYLNLLRKGARDVGVAVARAKLADRGVK
jgi:hypothetical protein